MSAAAALRRLPAGARATLLGRGLALEDLEAVLSWPESMALLVTGSMAEGRQTPASDVDLMVLAEEPLELDALAAARGLPPFAVQASTFIDRLLPTVKGVEFDIWLISAAKLRPLAAAVSRAFDERGTLLSLPGLQALEIKFLIRLRGGLPLQAPELVRRWRCRLRLELLPVLLIANLFVEALSLLEDAFSLAGSGRRVDELAGAIAARGAAERIVQASLCARGVVGWDLRHAARERESLRRRGEALPAPLQALEALLFPGAGARRAGYRERVLAMTAALFGELRQTPSMAGAVSFLRSFGHDRWRLDTGFLRE